MSSKKYHELDCRGMPCPLPVLRVMRAVSCLRPGQGLRILCDGRVDEADFAALFRKAGVSFLSSDLNGGQRIMTIHCPGSDDEGEIR